MCGPAFGGGCPKERDQLSWFAWDLPGFATESPKSQETPPCWVDGAGRSPSSQASALLKGPESRIWFLHGKDKLQPIIPCLWQEAKVQSLKTQQFVPKVHTRVLSERSQTQKSCMLYDSMYVTFWKRQNCRERKPVCSGRGRGKGLTAKGVCGKFLEW